MTDKLTDGTKVVRKKPPAAGKGRPKGALNKATTEFRVTVQKLLDDNRANVGKWLAMVAEGTQAELDAEGNVAKKGVPPAPDKALDLLAKLAEYAAPKLARTEHVGDGGGPVRIVASNLDEKL